MPTNADLTRRAFIRRTAAGVATAGSLLSLSPTEMAARPDATSPQPRMYSGCCVYSYGKHLDKGTMTTEDVIRKAVELRIDGVDMTTYWLKSKDPADLIADPSYLIGLRHLAFKNCVGFSGTAIASVMCLPDPEKRAAEVEKIKKWVDVTAILGASHIRVFGGIPPKGTPMAQAVRWATETMKAACEYSGKKGITLGIESHHGVTDKASDILEIIHGVDSPYAGINLDITNFFEDPYPQIEMCLPYATHAHIRDFFSKPKREPVDLDRVWQMFVKAGYKGYMSAEYEGEEDPMTGVPKLLEKIKALNKKYSTV
jgi:sugar phosphate isomerase/epimerase